MLPDTRSHSRSPDHGALATPLACLDEGSLMRLRVLMPTTARRSRGPCRGRASRGRASRTNNESRDLWTVLQQPRSCERGVHLRTDCHGGWVSTLHGLVKPVLRSVLHNASLLTPSFPLWMDRQLCKSQRLDCIFRPLSACDGAGPRQSSMESSCTGLAHAFDGEVFLAAASRPSVGRPRRVSAPPRGYAYLQAARRLREHFGHIGAGDGGSERRGWCRLVSQISAFITRPAAALQSDLDAALHSTGLGAALAGEQPVLGLHVRHGDACVDGANHARNCSTLGEYLHAVRQLAATLPGGISTIYLATDSPAVLAEARERTEFRFLHLADAADAAHAISPGGCPAGRAPEQCIWDYRARVNVRAHPSGRASNYRAVWLATLDVLLLARCALFVGKFSSSFFRLAYELKAAQCDCAAPFVSLDSA
jgi:hypothetical protein